MVGSHDGAGLARAHAANVGLDAATGELLLFLDDDDVLLPDHVAKLVAALAAAPQAPAAYGDVDFGRMEADGWRSRHVFAADFDPVRLCFENYLPIHAVLFRRGCVERGARVDERLPLLEDWDFWLQCATAGPFVRAPGVSARYHANSPGGSEVFEEGPQARESRATLFEKWHARLPSERFVDLMFRLQAHYRGEAYALAQLRLAQAEVAGLRAILAARDTEIASLHAALAERDVQAATAREYAESLRAVLDARDAEIASLRNETTLTALKRTLKRYRHAR
jgi:GT2 family glycosyltransferase